MSDKPEPTADEKMADALCWETMIWDDWRPIDTRWRAWFHGPVDAWVTTDLRRCRLLAVELSLWHSVWDTAVSDIDAPSTLDVETGI